MAEHAAPADSRGVAWTMIILAVSFGIGYVVFCCAVLWDALHSDQAGLSENATQILTGWGGGVVGVLGAYVGYRAAERPSTSTPATAPAHTPTQPATGVVSTDAP